MMSSLTSTNLCQSSAGGTVRWGPVSTHPQSAACEPGWHHARLQHDRLPAEPPGLLAARVLRRVLQKRGEPQTPAQQLLQFSATALSERRFHKRADSQTVHTKNFVVWNSESDDLGNAGILSTCLAGQEVLWQDCRCSPGTVRKLNKNRSSAGQLHDLKLWSLQNCT